MRWPWRGRGVAVTSEGKELAKSQLEVAKIIEAESEQIAHEHRWLLYANHFGPNTARAMRERRK